MIRELTPEEECQLLSQTELEAYPDGTPIMIKWEGGNGPHKYFIERDKYGDMGCRTVTRDSPVHGNWHCLDEGVGKTKYDHRVFLAIEA